MSFTFKISIESLGINNYFGLDPSISGNNSGFLYLNL